MVKYHLCKILRLFHLISKKKFRKIDAKYFPYLSLLKSKLFDRKWYLKTYPDVKSNPARHYLEIGWKKGYSPSLLFDGNKYLDTYPDVKKAHLNPLLHYECFGKFEKRIFCPVKSVPFTENKPTWWDRLFSNYKNKYPKISVIVTSFNYQNYIGETLKSLISQTYKNFEVIVVDDGSVDDSVSIITDYAKKYDFIHLYQHENAENKGLLQSLNLALNKSSGEYIAFCESDDFWDCSYLETKVKLIAQFASPIIIVNDVCLLGNYKRCLQIEKNILENLRHRYSQTINHFTYNDFRKVNYIPTLSCCMIRKKELMKCNLFLNPRPSATDWWIYRQLVARGYKIFYINKKLTYWRMHNSFNANQEINFKIYQPVFNKISDDLCHQKEKNEVDKNAQIIKKSNFFDAKWYCEKYNICDASPELHYLFVGWSMGYNPSEAFDGNLYLDFYDDVKKAQINPLLHYEIHGKNKRFVVSTLRDKLDILIITTVQKKDGVYIWRVKFFREMFMKNGFSVEEESLCNLSGDFLNKFYNAKVIIFNRPVNVGISAQILKEIIRTHKKLIIDIDDLLLSDYASFSGRYKSNGISYEDTLKAIYSQSLCFACGDYISVSTPFLKRELYKKVGVNTILLRNVISSEFCRKKQHDTTLGLKLLYTSGSVTHLCDVSTIFIDLFNILLKHKDVTLTILGKSDLQDALNIFEDRICIVPYSSFENMLDVYAQHDLVIVPLEVNPFNNAKSNIKYIEAAAVATPVLAQDCDEFKAVIQDGVNGFLYHDNFYEKFEDIYKQKKSLFTVGKNAFDDVLKKHTTDVELSKFIKDWIC